MFALNGCLLQNETFYKTKDDISSKIYGNNLLKTPLTIEPKGSVNGTVCFLTEGISDVLKNSSKNYLTIITVDKNTKYQLNYLCDHSIAIGKYYVNTLFCLQLLN